MLSLFSKLCGVTGLAATLVLPMTARAILIENENAPIQLDFTETADFDYHFNNGNGIIAPPSSPSYDPTSDNYGDWFNRFEAQLTTGPWHADLRFDSALFLNTPGVSNASTNEGRHLETLLINRYVNNIQVEKISASYLTPQLEATVGDLYLNYGRGMVISLRKIDALGVDTSLRGGSVTGRVGGFTANVAGGVTNFVNTDPSTGYVAPDPEDPVLGARVEYRLPKVFAIGLDGAIVWQNSTTLNLNVYNPTSPLPPQSYSLSPLGLGSIELSQISGTKPAGRNENYSATFELPDLFGHGSFYLEYAHQFHYVSGETQGDAFYSDLSLYLKTFTLQLEGKAYLGYDFPTFSSLPVTGGFVAFWQQAVYTNPPNLEQLWQEEDLSYRTYGPRVRLDWQASENLKPFGSFAFFRDETNYYDIYDSSLGIDANWKHHRSHVSFAGGYRRLVFNDLAPSPGVLYKTEWWLQWDLLQALWEGYSLEFEGLHRTHRDYENSPTYLGWSQGYAYVSLRHHQWSLTGGTEYYTEAETLNQPLYFNGSGSYSFNQNFLVRAFVGGRAAGLRCFNGVCRNYPGFNGATVELVARY